MAPSSEPRSRRWVVGASIALLALLVAVAVGYTRARRIVRPSDYKGTVRILFREVEVELEGGGCVAIVSRTARWLCCIGHRT